MEDPNTTDYIVIDGTAASITGIGFYGAKFLQSVTPTTGNIFNLKAAYNVEIDGVSVQDLVSAAGRNLIKVNAVNSFTVANVDIYMTNTFNFIVGITALTTSVLVKNCNYRSGAAGTNSFLCTGLVVIGSNMLSNFQSTSTQVTMINSSGAINTSNLTATSNVTCINCGSVTDAGNFATQMFNGKDITPINTLANSATPSISTGGKLWLTGGTTTITNITGGAIGQILTIISAHAITITTGTNIFLEGAANFVMASADILTLVQQADGKWYETARKTTGVDPYTQYVLVSGARAFSGNARLGSNWIGNDGGNEGLQFDTSGNATLSGQVLQPAQPSFLVVDGTGGTDVTGDGTGYTQLWPTEIYDQASNFGSNTFTAPVTGRYLLSASIMTQNILVTHTYRQFTIVTSNRSYNEIPQYALAQDSLTLTVTCIADMDANDTATVTLGIGGGTKTVDIVASASRNYFSGSLLN